MQMGNVREFVGAEPPTDEDFIVIHPKLGVEVYPNQKGQIVIKNIGDPNRDDDDLCYALIEPEDAEMIAKAIIAMAADLRGDSPF
jgi:hypothetical protein